MIESIKIRHSREIGNPAGLLKMPFWFVFAAQGAYFLDWIPAFAGMTRRRLL